MPACLQRHPYARPFPRPAAPGAAGFDPPTRTNSQLGAVNWVGTMHGYEVPIKQLPVGAGIATRKDYLVLTLKAEADIRSPRIRKREQTSPGRWHLDIKLVKPQEVDHELQQWMRASYLLAK